MGAALEKVWGSVSGLPGRTSQPPGAALLRTLPPFSRVRGPHPHPDFLHLGSPEPASGRPRHVEALSARLVAPPTWARGSAGSTGLHPKEKDFGRRTPDPAPDRVGRVGARLL